MGAWPSRENQPEPASQLCVKSLEASAATPRLAVTCAAVRPCRLSAVPNRSFCFRPRRVPIQVSTKTAITGASAVRQG